MFPESLVATATALAAHCRNGTEAEGLATLYAPDCVSVEALPMANMPAEIVGIEAIRGKHAWWNGAMEVHGGSVGGPFLHAPDRFAMTFEMDATERATGKRSQMKEVGIYTVNPDGKIVREEFYYSL